MYLPELSRRRKTYQKALNNEAFANDENNSLSKLTKHIAHASVEIHRKFALPFAALIMALIAMPLGIQPPRAHKTWGASVSVMLGMGVIVIYYGLLSIGTSLAQSTALPAWLGLWLPNLALAPLAYIGITKISREEWLSIATALESVVKTLSLIHI